MGLSNLVLEMGCTGKRKGMSRTFSQLQAVPQLGGFSSSAVPSSIPCCGGPGVGLPVAQVAGGEQSPWVLLPVPGTSLF